MHRSRNAKIIATLGPASSDASTIEDLFRAGADIFRLNFSHGSHAQHEQVFNNIRSLERTVDRPIGVLLDLQGPKLRLGEFARGKVSIRNGQPFQLDMDPAAGDEDRVQLPHPEIFAALEEGTTLLLDDGKVHLEVVNFSDTHAETLVRVGGELADHKWP